MQILAKLYEASNSAQMKQKKLKMQGHGLLKIYGPILWILREKIVGQISQYGF